MPQFEITWDGWDRLNVRGRIWLQKRTSGGLILLKLISENGLGIDREVSLDADAVRICRAIRSGTWGSHIKNLPLKIFSK